MFFFQALLLTLLFLVLLTIGVGIVGALFIIIASITSTVILSGLFTFLAIAILGAGVYSVFMIAYKIVKTAAEKMDKEN